MMRCIVEDGIHGVVRGSSWHRRVPCTVPGNQPLSPSQTPRPSELEDAQGVTGTPNQRAHMGSASSAIGDSNLNVSFFSLSPPHTTTLLFFIFCIWVLS